jgi:LemA protein
VITRSFAPKLIRAAVLGTVLSLTGCGVNNIPTFEQDAKAKWAEVQNQYKRRADLIPNLLETVKGFSEQERSILIGVTEARSKATSVQIPADIITNPEAMKKFQEAQATLGGALRQLLVASERYPDIKSGENFRMLQSQLEGTENRISIARHDYIDSVRVFNTEITTVPGRWWRSFMYASSKEMATFDIPVEETKAPKIDFGTKKN